MRLALRTEGAAAARLVFWLVTSIVAGLVPPAAARAAIAVESERQGDVVDIRATATLRADPATAWRVLTDYDRFTQFIPGLHSSRVLARKGPTVLVEQLGDAAIGPFRVPMRVTFEITEAAPTRLESHAVAGSFQALASSYTLTAVGAGTRLDYVGHVESGFAFFRDMQKSAVERNVTRQFRALVDEIDRQAAAPTHDK